VPGGAPKLVYLTVVQNIQFGCLAPCLEASRRPRALVSRQATFFLRQQVAPLTPHPQVPNFGRGWFYATATCTKCCTLAVFALGYIP
jgi:hypothetical protein